MNLSSLCIASAAVGLSCMAASSAVGGVFYEFEFVIDADQQVPPNDSEGMGFGFVTLQDETLSFLLTWDISWSGLTGPAIGMHFHGPADFGMNASIQVDIGAISGLTSPSIGSTVIDNLQAAQILEGLWYVNIHSDMFPGGEIRGQVIPAPGALALLGLGGLLARRRRRR